MEGDFRPAVYYFPKDLISSLALRLSFKHYKWINVIRRDGVALKREQVIGLTVWEDEITEYLIRSKYGILHLFSEGRQGLDTYLRDTNVLHLATPRSHRTYLPYLLLLPKSRRVIQNCVIGLSFVVFYAHFLSKIIENSEGDFVSFTLAGLVLASGPAVFLFALLMKLGRIRL